MLWFILGAVIGCIFGFIVAVLGQQALEETYVKSGLAKINRKYYLITPYNHRDDDQDENISTSV